MLKSSWLYFFVDTLHKQQQWNLHSSGAGCQFKKKHQAVVPIMAFTGTANPTIASIIITYLLLEFKVYILSH